MNAQMQRPEIQEDPHSAGLHSGNDEDDRQSKKSVLKKVKNKAKKLKDTIVKHGHGYDHDHDHEEDDEDEEIKRDPEVHEAHGDLKSYSVISSQDIGAFELEEDPDAPRDPTQKSEPGNYQTKVSDPTYSGGDEAEASPITSAFEKLEVSDKSPAGSHVQFSPNVNTKTGQQQKQNTEEQKQSSTYTEKISAATSAITQKAKSAKNAIFSKLGYSEDPNTKTEHSESTNLSEKLGLDKGVSVKKYLVEKLKPSEEDKALSEVISTALHDKLKMESKEEKGRVGNVTESPEVASRLGSGSDEEMSNNNKRVVDRVKELATSWFGKGGETNPSLACPSPSYEKQEGPLKWECGGREEASRAGELIL